MPRSPPFSIIQKVCWGAPDEAPVELHNPLSEKDRALCQGGRHQSQLSQSAVYFRVSPVGSQGGGDLGGDEGFQVCVCLGEFFATQDRGASYGHNMQLKTMSQIPKYLTQDELRRFFKVITSPRDRAMFALIYHYGLRVDEAAALTVEDVDLKNHRIRIRRLKNGIGGEKPVWRHTAKLLRTYLRVRRNVTPYLFTGRQGSLKKRQIQHLFTHYAKAAGLTTRTFLAFPYRGFSKYVCGPADDTP